MNTPNTFICQITAPTPWGVEEKVSVVNNSTIYRHPLFTALVDGEKRYDDSVELKFTTAEVNLRTLTGVSFLNVPAISPFVAETKELEISPKDLKDCTIELFDLPGIKVPGYQKIPSLLTLEDGTRLLALEGFRVLSNSSVDEEKIIVFSWEEAIADSREYGVSQINLLESLLKNCDSRTVSFSGHRYGVDETVKFFDIENAIDTPNSYDFDQVLNLVNLLNTFGEKVTISGTFVKLP